MNPIEEPKYAQVILDLVSDALDKPFQYTIPARYRQQLNLAGGCWFLSVTGKWKGM